MKNISFENLIKDKLTHLEGDVRPELWNNINKSLPTKVNSNNWNGGAAVAIVGLVALGLLIGNYTSVGTTKTSIAEEKLMDKKVESNIEKSVLIEKVEEIYPVNKSSQNEPLKISKKAAISNELPKDDSENLLPQIVSGGNVDTKQVSDNTQPYQEPKQLIAINKKPKKSVNESIGADTAPIINVETKADIIHYIDLENSLKVSFSASLENLSYDWNFGDGAHSVEVNPSHVYDKEGKYNVLCTITDSKSNKIINTKKVIEVIEPLVMFVPNSFSPNNDGNNDFYQVVVHSKISEFKMDIYDLRQNLLFTTNNYSDKWAGPERLNPSNIQDTRFVAVIKVKTNSGRSETKTTSITIN